MKRFVLTPLLVTLLAGVPMSLLKAQEQGSRTDDLRVDFLNSDTRSVSLPLGSEDGLTGESFFALLDDGNRVITEIYPFEILHNRIWSGPMTPDVFERVGVGTRAIRITLSRTDIQRIKGEYENRANLLRGKQVSRRRERLLQEYRELEESILLTSNRKTKTQRERAELQERLRMERRELGMRIERITSRLDQLRDELDDLNDERSDLVEERRRLQERNNPPQARIQRLSGEIAEKEDEIRDVRDEIRDLRDERLDAEQDAERRGISRIRSDLDDLDAEELEIQMELDRLELERETIRLELENLRD